MVFGANAVQHHTVPNASVIACLVNPTSQRSASQVQQIQDSARLLGLKLQIVNASSEQELETAFTTIVRDGLRDGTEQWAHAPQQAACIFDHLVGAGEQCRILELPPKSFSGQAESCPVLTVA